MTDNLATKPVVSPQSSRLWLIFAMVWTAMLPLYLVLDYYGQSVLYSGAAVAAMIATLVGVRLHKPRHPVAWYLFAAGLLSSVLADSIYVYYELTRDSVPWPSISEVFYIGYYVAAASGLLVLLRSGSRRRDLGSYIDAGVITASAALLSWTFLISPAIVDEDLPLLDLIVSVSFPIGDLLILALIAKLAFNARSRVPSVFILLVGFTLYLVADAIYGYQVLNDGYVSGGLLDYGWIIGYLLLGVAALHPSMLRAEEQERHASEHLTWQRLGVLTIVPVVALAILALRDIISGPTDSAVTIGGALGLFLLALARIALLVRDVNAATEETRASHERYDLMSLATNDVIWDLNPHDDTLIWSDAMATHLGHAGRQSTFDWWKSIIHPDDLARVAHSIQNALTGDGTTWSDDYRIRRGDGGVSHVIDRGFIVRDRAGSPIRMVGAITDVTAHKELEERLQYQAFHDSLTGLHNREIFRERLLQAMSRSPHGASRVAVLFIDVDRFKYVNDTLGHEAGDQLLIEISQRLSQCIRATDTLSRRGGDEFTILLDGADEEQACAAAQRIGAVLRDPITLGSQEVLVTASIGISLGEPGLDEADDMIRAADVAMYDAKSRGRARYEIFDGTRDPFTVEALQLESDLRHAVEREEFTVVYQPMVALHSGQQMFLEALVRWQHPERGLLLPGEFLPVAEETGLIVPIGRQVLDTVLRQIVVWLREQPTADLPPVFVNCSAREFRDTRLAQDIEELLLHYGLAGERIGIEINEQVVLADAEAAWQTIERLRAMGVHLALDDFGTGNSSLSHLRHMPVDILKIDKRFTNGLGTVSDDRVLIHALIAVGRSLGIRVLAEGVETEGQLQELQGLGCELGQGYLFARPMPASALIPFLQADANPAAPAASPS